MKRQIWGVEHKAKGKPWELAGYEDTRYWARHLQKQLKDEFPHFIYRIVKYVPERKFK
jgi:hypothetical protein